MCIHSEQELHSRQFHAKNFTHPLGIDLTAIEAADSSQRIQLIDNAIDLILVNDETKRNFLEQARNVYILFKAILPDTAANEFSGICSLINIIARKIRSLSEPVDISDVTDEIEELLDQSIAPEGYIINAGRTTYDTELIDLSQIDFEQLAERINTEHKRTQAEKLKGGINRKLRVMIQLNRTRIDLQEKFEQMIAEYNEGHITDDGHLQEILAFLESLSEEEQRADNEELSEEELALYDLLTQPEPHLTVPQREEVKTAVRELLETLKQTHLVLDWRKQQQLRAKVKSTVQTTLDEGLPECYDAEMFGQKSEAIYQHIYDSYYGEENSIYTETHAIGN